MLYQNAWSATVPYLPRYTMLEAVAAEETPSRIVEWEASDEFTALCEQQARMIIPAAGAQSPLHPFFFSATLPEHQGIVSIQSRTGPRARCAVFFSSEIRAATYASILLSGLKITPVQFTAAEFADTLISLSKVGLNHFVLDRCPRCWSFPITVSSTIPNADAAVAHWSFVKAVELTRANYYLKVAQHRAASGDYAGSRDIALLAVAHVAPDDPRVHSHLVAMAEHLNDAVLLMEAKSALQHTRCPDGLPFFRNIEWRMIDSALKI